MLTRRRRVTTIRVGHKCLTSGEKKQTSTSNDDDDDDVGVCYPPPPIHHVKRKEGEMNNIISPAVVYIPCQPEYV